MAIAYNLQNLIPLAQIYHVLRLDFDFILACDHADDDHHRDVGQGFTSDKYLRLVQRYHAATTRVFHPASFERLTGTRIAFRRFLELDQHSNNSLHRSRTSHQEI